MPIPSSVEDLDPAAANNSPGGSEPIGPNLDGYLRAHAALIRQVSDASKVETQIHGATSKATPVDADELPIADSEASFGRKKLTLANLKAALKTYFDTLYLKLSGGEMTGLLKFAPGNAIASAATVDLTTATGNTVHITGTTGISAWTMKAGQVMDVIIDGVLTLTHHASTNNLPSGANITTAAGDRARYFYDGTTVYCMNYTRADGSALAGQRMMLTAAVSTTSGTAIDFTNIPSWVKQITVLFNGVSTSGTSSPLLQIGDSGGVENSGYTSVVHHGPNSGVSSTAGFIVDASASASSARYGSIALCNVTDNIWVSRGLLSSSAGFVETSAGGKTLTGVLDRVRLTTTNGTDTFDAGSVSLLIEG